MKLTPETIRICRSNLGITQGTLAKRIGISGSLLGAIEREERILLPAVERRIREAFRITDNDITEFLAAHDKLNKIAGGE